MNSYFYDYHITEDSFGAMLPENWEGIAAFLNELIDKALENTDGAFDPSYDGSGLSFDGHVVVNDIWERYCAGDIAGAPSTTIYDYDKIRGEYVK